MSKIGRNWLGRGSVMALAAAGLIGLGACSGSDGLNKAEEAALQQEVEAAEAAKQEAEAAKQAAEAAKQEAEAAKQEAEAAKQEAEAAKQEAEDARAEAERQRQAEQQRRQQEEQARQAAEREQEQLERQLTEAEQAELRARAGSFGAALDLSPPGTSVLVSWPRGGRLTFRPSGSGMTPGAAAPGVPGGWRSAGFTGQTGTAGALVDQTVYLYTDIQAPGSRAFWKVHGLSVDMDDPGVSVSLARGSSATPNADTDPDTDGHQYSKLTVSGSLSGASGKFTCASCTGTVGGLDGIDSHVAFAQGTPTFDTPGDWTFTPSNIANGYRVNTDDAYLYFGIWSSIPDDIAGRHDFEYVAGGGAQSGAALSNFDALTGSATFRGGAVGRYVTRGQLDQNDTIGTFTATATLNADFGAADAAGTLGGTITDFREGGSPLAGWRVTLGADGDVGEPATISPTTTPPTPANTAVGDTVANIGGLTAGGSWGAAFHGSDNEELLPRDKYPKTQYPPVDLAGVTGWFDATTGANCPSVCLAGAFGATPANN